jgi:hypothetical protein
MFTCSSCQNHTSGTAKGVQTFFSVSICNPESSIVRSRIRRLFSLRCAPPSKGTRGTYTEFPEYRISMFAANLRTFFSGRPGRCSQKPHARIYSQAGLFQSCCSHSVTEQKVAVKKRGSSQQASPLASPPLVETKKVSSLKPHKNPILQASAGC